MAKRILVIGLGRFGTALALGLSERGCDVIAVDKRMEMIEPVKDKLSFVVELDATETEALAAIDAKSCSAAVVAIGDSFEQTVLTVAALKECGVARVIARSRDKRQSRILRAVGASDVVEVETEVGRRYAEDLAKWVS